MTGRCRRLLDLAAKNIEAFDGFDLVVATAAGCSAHLREYGHLRWRANSRAVPSDVTQTVAELIASRSPAAAGSTSGTRCRPGPVPPAPRSEDHGRTPQHSDRGRIHDR